MQTMVGIGVEKLSTAQQGLESSLTLLCQDEPTGHWLFSWQESSEGRISRHILLSEGKLVYAGRENLTGTRFIEILRRYTPKFQEKSLSSASFVSDRALSASDLNQLITEFLPADGMSLQDILQTLRLAVLEELDRWPFDDCDREVNVVCHREFPPLKFSDRLEPLEDLLAASTERRQLWRKLEASVPSLELVPKLDRQAMAKSALNEKQKKRLEHLTRGEKTLAEIAISSAKDRLEIARVFAQLVEGGLVTLQEKPADGDGSSGGLPIVIVDDSPVLVKKFRSLAEHWGYRVRTVLDATQAVDAIREAKPIVAFIDVNMPGISGFELVKQIRSCPETAEVPLAILTAEKKLSNKWQAKWSGCKFLTKPLASEEVSQFKADLQAILQECAFLKG